jgi:hypothetical protein
MEWKDTDKEFGALQVKFERDVTAKLKGRFTAFAILDIWDFATPSNCQFAFDKHGKQGSQIPQAIQTTIKESHFIPEEFDEVVLSFAKTNASVADLLKELQEPLPGGKHSIPWIGEADIKDCIEHLVARGLIALNLRGSNWVQAGAGETESDALQRIRGKLANVTGTHLATTTLHLPSATPSTGGVFLPANGSESTVTPPPGGTMTPNGLFGGSTPFPPLSLPTGGTDSNSGSGGGITSTVPTTPHVLTSSANSPLNLQGTVEQWGITGQTKMRILRLSTEGVTGAQLLALLRKLPEGKYVLEVQKEEDV